MTKRLSALIAVSLSILLLTMASLSAQTPPKKVLSSKDVDSFAANFEALNDDLDAVGGKYDDIFGSNENESPSQILAKLRTTKIPAEIQDILRKHGLGENGFEKLMTITIGFSALEMETYLNDQLAQYGSSPEVQPYIDQGMAQVKELKAAIHKDDLALLASKRDLLYPLMVTDTAGAADEEFDDSGDGDSGDYADDSAYDEDYGD